MSAPSLRERLSRMQLLEHVDAIAARYGTTVEDIESPSHQHNVSRARHEAMLLVRALRDHGGPVFSLSDIGRMFGRDHTTVVASVRRARARLGVSRPSEATPIEHNVPAALGVPWVTG